MLAFFFWHYEFFSCPPNFYQSRGYGSVERRYDSSSFDASLPPPSRRPWHQHQQRQAEAQPSQFCILCSVALPTFQHVQTHLKSREHLDMVVRNPDLLLEDVIVHTDREMGGGEGNGSRYSSRQGNERERGEEYASGSAGYGGPEMFHEQQLPSHAQAQQVRCHQFKC